MVPVLIAKGDNRKPEFLKLSPLGKIPCLQASLACAALRCAVRRCAVWCGAVLGPPL